MSLFGRIAWTGAGLLAVVALLALLVWKPANERAFVRTTDDLRRDAERDFRTIALSRVDAAMAFATATTLAADEQRARAIEDLPLDLFLDADGKLHQGRLREAFRAAVADPAIAGGQKNSLVRAEILARTRQDIDARLERLREARAEATVAQSERQTWRTLTAWGGILLVVLAGWAFVLDRIVVRPVREITVAVGRFGAGERGERIAPHGAAELTTLADAFNGMAGAVEGAERENADLRLHLEEKVKERTAALVRAARASTAGTMAGGVAHEFNNLLGGILGCAEAALDDQPKAEVREALEMIRKTAGRGVGVTSALRRATSATPERAPCDLAALFDEALAEVRPGDDVRVLRDVGAVTSSVDAAMLRQVLANLIRNAVDAGATQVRLGLRATADDVVLEITDDGPGIEPSIREIMFEPFVTTRPGGREGTGLGLFLAERLVHAHGGRIEVGDGIDGGTNVSIHLPNLPG